MSSPISIRRHTGVVCRKRLAVGVARRKQLAVGVARRKQLAVGVARRRTLVGGAKKRPVTGRHFAYRTGLVTINLDQNKELDNSGLIVD